MFNKWINSTRTEKSIKAMKGLIDLFDLMNGKISFNNSKLLGIKSEEQGILDERRIAAMKTIESFKNLSKNDQNKATLAKFYENAKMKWLMRRLYYKLLNNG